MIAGLLIVGLGACADAPDVGSAVATGASAPSPPEERPRHSDPTEFMDAVIRSQLDAGSVRMTMSTTAPAAMSLEAAMVFDDGTGQPGVDMTIDSDGTEMALRLVGGQAYIRVDSMTGEKYVHVDPADEGNPLRSIATQMASSDPVEQSRDVRGAVTSVTAVRREPVDGVNATRYSVTIDPGKVTGKTAESFGASLLGVDEVIYDYWLDDADHPIQVAFTLEIDGTSLTTTLKMRDWGEVPPILAPTGDQVTTLEELGLVG